ncbi:hypothetical protein BpHYR1_014923 [Brachionus plicatilis]|uniref:Uncharacterized protein n=1 Tax=Brachionus plicatilis TaxID=10195 RepID=A0A3M7RFY8_BRAPC|nr:hypothetical protein BpHYR1_014923 [Brachionus plicatilis]
MFNEVVKKSSLISSVSIEYLRDELPIEFLNNIWIIKNTMLYLTALALPIEQRRKRGRPKNGTPALQIQPRETQDVPSLQVASSTQPPNNILNATSNNIVKLKELLNYTNYYFYTLYVPNKLGTIN